MSIYKKLLKVQEELGAISKDSTNPHFKNSYFDINSVLEEVKPILSKNELVLTQPLIDGKVFSIITDVETLETIESFLCLPDGEKNPQKIGSCLTYYRRYTLTCLLGIQGEDDDANLAATPAPKPAPKPKPKPKKKLEMTEDIYQKSVDAVKEGKVTIDQIKAKYELSETNEKALKALIKL